MQSINVMNSKIISAMVIFILGMGLGISINIAGAAESDIKPAYMVVSSDRNPNADYGPYSRAAGPLARDAGMQMLASGQEPLVLEGTWPYKNMTLEIYPSMEALKDFWYSDEYQDAKKLREGLSNVNFIVAIEAD